MSLIAAINGTAPTAWFVNPKGELIALRPQHDDAAWAVSTARAFESRYFIRLGAPPVAEARIPQEWLIYDILTKGKDWQRRMVKRIFSATVDAAHMWCLHMRDHS